MAGHQLKKLAQNRGKGIRYSLVDVVPKHWSVYTLLFSTVFLVVFCFLLFDIRTSPTALLLHASNQLGALRAQAGEMYYQSTGNSPADFVVNANFRKGLQHPPEDSNGDDGGNDEDERNQKRKPKSLTKGTKESSNEISGENEVEGKVRWKRKLPTEDPLELESSNSDIQESSADSEEHDTDEKHVNKRLKVSEKEISQDVPPEVVDSVIEEQIPEEEVPDEQRVDRESTQKVGGVVKANEEAEEKDGVEEPPKDIAKPEEGEEEYMVVEEKVERKKDAGKKSSTNVSEKENEVSTSSTDEKIVSLAVTETSDASASFEEETVSGSVEITGKTTEVKGSEKKEAQILETEKVSDSTEENLNEKKTNKKSKSSKPAEKTPSDTSGQEILKQVTSDGKCDYSVGKWVYDESYPLYKPDSCPFVDGGFRCVENGRPSAEFQKYRWQPAGCNLPRFDAKGMLEKLRGRRLAFVGDSIGRNNWESQICMLADAVSNKSRIYEINGEPITKHKGFLSFRFEDYNCTVEYYRSPYLVPQGRAPPNSPPEVHSTFKLDQIDWSAKQWKDADILIFNSGHWWSFEKTIRGGNYFQVKDKVRMKMEVGDAFRRAMQTVAKYVDENIDPQKSQVFWRSYAPVHFRGGTWKTGGSCIDEQRPLLNLTLYQEPWVNRMVSEVTKGNTRTPITFLNVTFASDHRADGHSSIWQRVPPSPINRQDCSHWCLPGVPDTWNEFLYAALLDRGQGQWGDKTE